MKRLAVQQGRQIVSISVPANVRDEMRRRTDVNWSRVCVAAITRMLRQNVDHDDESDLLAKSFD